MLDTIYNFLFTPIMSNALIGIFYGVKPIIIIMYVFIAIVSTIIIVILCIKFNIGNSNKSDINNLQRFCDDINSHITDPKYQFLSCNIHHIHH